MEKGKIRRLQNLSDELMTIQEFFIHEAEDRTDYYISQYKKHPSSLDGKYIVSDLFKETFDLYTESLESRGKYSEVIHNSAAVLANEMFHITAKDKNIKKCVFISGVPGAGKSFLVQSLVLAGFWDKDTMIYEGDVTTPTIVEKIKTVLDAGKEVSIIVVNPTLELAQRNAINRSYEMGRGASCETMARILSKLPIALRSLHSEFPEIALAVYSKATNYDIECDLGWDIITKLEHGNYDEVLQKLREYRIQILEEIQEDLKKKSNSLKQAKIEGEENESKQTL